MISLLTSRREHYELTSSRLARSNIDLLDFVSFMESCTRNLSWAHSYDVSDLKKQNMYLKKFMKAYVKTTQERGHLFERQFAKVIFGLR